MPDLSALARSATIGQAVSCLVLAGLALVVQVVVYPGLITVGESAPAVWVQAHGAHSRRIGLAVGGPWLVQGVTCALLPFVSLPGVPLWQPLLAGFLGLVTVVDTLVWAIPLHQGLEAEYDDGLARALLRANAVRLLAWAAAGGLAVVMLLGH